VQFGFAGPQIGITKGNPLCLPNHVFLEGAPYKTIYCATAHKCNLVLQVPQIVITKGNPLNFLNHVFLEGAPYKNNILCNSE
jgi:hypothetical protein